MADKVLSVNNLVINFKTDNGMVHAVRNVSFDLERGETLCIVGESGSGKSVTSKAIMGILANNAIIEKGSIIYQGENLLEVSEEEFYKIRGHKIGMIFQDPLSSLNPIVRIGKQITEATLINSDKLKLMYNDLISNDLIAYKNVFAKRDIRIHAIENELREYIDTISKEKENGENKKAKDLIQQKRKECKKLIAKIKEEAIQKSIPLKEKLEQTKREAKEKVWKHKNEILSNSRSKINQLQKQLSKVSSKEEKNKITEEIAQVKKETTNALKITKAEAKRNDLISNDLIAYKNVFAKRDIRIHAIENELREYIDTISKEKENGENKKAKDLIQQKRKECKKLIAKIKEEAIQKSIPLKEKLEQTKREAKEKVWKHKNEILSNSRSKINQLQKQLSKVSSKEEKNKITEEIAQVKKETTNALKITKAEAKRRALEIMKEVGIPEPERRFKQYPFEFSGGMRQRIVIAIALTANPEILICDEPTTALDVTIQAQILELINRIKQERDLSCIFITHDLGVVANMADRVAVMYAGKIVECGMAEEVFFDPRHPYTWALLSSIPDVNSKERLEAIPGTPPNMIYPPKGDAFALRSKYAMKIDFEEEPPFFKVTDTHYAATWLLDERAPTVEKPRIVMERIKNALKEDE